MKAEGPVWVHISITESRKSNQHFSHWLPGALTCSAAGFLLDKSIARACEAARSASLARERRTWWRLPFPLACMWLSFSLSSVAASLDSNLPLGLSLVKFKADLDGRGGRLSLASEREKEDLVLSISPPLSYIYLTLAGLSTFCRHQIKESLALLKALLGIF